MSEDHMGPGPAGATRRALLTSAGALGVGALLAGCGDSQTGAVGGGDRAGAGAAPGSDSTAGGSAPLARTTDIPVGGGKIFAAAGVVVTQPTTGVFKGFSSICTHQACPLSGVDGGTINCACHGSKFGIEDGSVKAGPATAALRAKEIKVDGDTITLA